MPKCTFIRPKKRKVCSGDLRHKITLQTRSLTPPTDVDFTEDFVTLGTPFAAIITLKGVVFFDGVNTETVATHDFIIRFRSDVTAETWILYKNQRYDILFTENYEERNTFLLMRCAKSGEDTKNMSAV